MIGVSKRSAFVIDQQRIVTHLEVLDDAGQVPDFIKIKEALHKLQVGS